MKNRKVASRIRKFIKAQRAHREFGAEAPAALEGVDCDLCYDEAWWPANGFSEAERRAICGPDGLNCPGIPPANND